MDRGKLQNLAISETGFVFNPATGHSYTTNEVGLKILNLFKSKLSDDNITRHICEEYDVSEDEIDIDLNEFKLSLEKNFLI